MFWDDGSLGRKKAQCIFGVEVRETLVEGLHDVAHYKSVAEFGETSMTTDKTFERIEKLFDVQAFKDQACRICWTMRARINVAINRE